MTTHALSAIQKVINRIGLPFVFFSFGIWELVEPDMWTSFVPVFMQSIMSADILVIIHGVVLVVVGFAVLIGFMLRYAYLLTALILLEIVISLIFQGVFTPILVRDIGLFSYAVALTLNEWIKGKEVSPIQT